MKMYIVVTTHEDDMTEVEVFRTLKEASVFIKATIGDVIVDFYRDNCLDEIYDYLSEVNISSDEDGYVYYAEFGPEGFKTYLEVFEKEVDIK